MLYAGLKIYVVPSMISAPRSWRERLFSWPWRPWVSTKMVPNDACPPHEEVLLIEDAAYVSEEGFHLLKQSEQVSADGRVTC